MSVAFFMHGSVRVASRTTSESGSRRPTFNNQHNKSLELLQYRRFTLYRHDRQCSSNSHKRFRNHEFNHGIHHFDVSAWKIVFAATKRRKKFGGGGARKFRLLRRRAVFFSAAAAARTRFRLARRRNSAADRSTLWYVTAYLTLKPITSIASLLVDIKNVMSYIYAT